MLQSEAGYIDARPQLPDRRKPLATHGRTIHSCQDPIQSRYGASRLSLEPEHCLQEPLHRLAGRNRGGLVVTDMGIDLHARIPVGKRLARLGIDDDAARLFLQLTCTHTLRTLQYGRCLRREWIVKDVVCVWEFSQLGILAGSTQAFEIGTAWSYGYIVVCRAMELPDRHRADFGVADDRHAAFSVKRNVRRKFDAFWMPGLLEARKAGGE